MDHRRHLDLAVAEDLIPCRRAPPKEPKARKAARLIKKEEKGHRIIRPTCHPWGRLPEEMAAAGTMAALNSSSSPGMLKYSLCLMGILNPVMISVLLVDSGK
jgi:hypothetical protein